MPILNILLACLLALGATNAYINVKEPNDLYKNTFAENYVLAFMHNAKTTPSATKIVHKIVNAVENLDIVKQENIIVHLIYTDDVNFFNKGYKLDGRNGLKLFIKNQLLTMNDFDDLLIEASKYGNKVDELVDLINKFISDNIAKISVYITNIEQFKKIIDEKRIVGLYTGKNNDNYKKYLHVARKNIDFPFLHIFDSNLANEIFIEFAKREAPKEDTFTIFRHVDDLKNFENDPAISINNFNEKILTEFLEFERYPKLRDMSYASINTKKLFYKYQPMVLYSFGSSKEAATGYETFKEAVKYLPKNMIYAVMDPDHPDVMHYTQLFLMANSISQGEGLVILHITPSQDVRMKPFNEPFTTDNIIMFVKDFYKQNKGIFDGMRKHLYDKEITKQEAETISEEL